MAKRLSQHLDAIMADLEKANLLTKFEKENFRREIYTLLLAKQTGQVVIVFEDDHTPWHEIVKRTVSDLKSNDILNDEAGTQYGFDLFKGTLCEDTK